VMAVGQSSVVATGQVGQVCEVGQKGACTT
jgi:hypothetical protein